MSTSHQDLDGLTGAFLGISTVIVGLRFASRYLQKARLAADDWLMLASYFLFVSLMAAVLYGTHHRTLGYSTPKLKAQPVLPQVSVGVNRAIDTLASAYFGCVKASALMFFRRVLCVPGRTDAFKVAIWVLLGLTAIWSILYILIPVFQCGTHVSNAWGPIALRTKYCQLSDPYLESQSVTDVAFDLIILLLPLPRIWSLKTNLRRRLAITFVFSTAVVSLAAGIAKTVIVFLISRKKITGDVQLATTQAYFMWVLEAGFAMIAVNLPTLVWLKHSKAPESILRSVRSFLSVNSQGSRGGDGMNDISNSRSTSKERSSSAGLDKGYKGNKSNTSVQGNCGEDGTCGVSKEEV